MLQRIWLVSVFVLSACVTVNIYFPAAAVERAADEIVRETWGGPQSPPSKVQPQSRRTPDAAYDVSFSLVSPAFAQDADFDVSNPAIRGLRESIKRRSGDIKPYMDKGNVGINQEGLLAIRNNEGLNLKERAEIQQLVDAENRDRERLYAEIARANNLSPDAVAKIKRIFAGRWKAQAQPGWWVQDEQGAWQRK